MKIYTKTGDDGTTGLLFGGRVPKDSQITTAYGTVDEAQAAIGVARAEADPGSELDTMLIEIERDLWILMSELATHPSNRHKLKAGETLVTVEMAQVLEGHIDGVMEHFELPKGFVIPGENRCSALLDLARTVVRRAERDVLGAGLPDDSSVLVYLNRLSDLLWALARWQEGTARIAKDV